MLVSFLSGEFLLHIPCWLHFYLGSFSDISRSGLPFHVGRFSYTSLAGFIFIWGVSLTHPTLVSFLSGEFLLQIPCWLNCCCFSKEFLLHIPCWFHFYTGSFSDTSRSAFLFMRGVSLTHPLLVSFLFGEFLLHIPCWLHFYLGSFSDTSRSGLPFHVGRFSYTPLPDFICIWGVSLTHPTLASFLSGEFLLHIPCWFNFFFGGVSLTHPMLI